MKVFKHRFADCMLLLGLLAIAVLFAAYKAMPL
jgi:hypothetical protein